MKDVIELLQRLAESYENLRTFPLRSRETTFQGLLPKVGQKSNMEGVTREVEKKVMRFFESGNLCAANSDGKVVSFMSFALLLLDRTATTDKSMELLL